MKTMTSLTIVKNTKLKYSHQANVNIFFHSSSRQVNNTILEALVFLNVSVSKPDDILRKLRWLHIQPFLTYHKALL